MRTRTRNTMAPATTPTITPIRESFDAGGEDEEGRGAGVTVCSGVDVGDDGGGEAEEELDVGMDNRQDVSLPECTKNGWVCPAYAEPTVATI